MKLSIIIPCFNEEKTIKQVLNATCSTLLPPGWDREVIIVDDGSKDGTRDVLRSLKQIHENVKIIYKDRNEGKGSSLKVGFAAASGDYIIIQDADTEYDPQDYAKLLTPILKKEATIVFGSRILEKNNVPFNMVYFYGGLAVTKIFNLFFRTKLGDITTCYKLFPASIVHDLIYLPSNDFVFDAVELTHVLVQSGKIKEVPIRYTARTKKEGKKLNWKHGVRCFFSILRIRFDTDGFIRKLRYRMVIKHIKHGNILDVGCGPNFHFLCSVKDKISIGYGIDKKTQDFSSDKLKIFSHSFDSKEYVPFPPEIPSVDQVFMLAVLEHLHYPKETLDKLYAVLKEGGEIHITTPSTFARPILEFLAFRLHIIDEAEIQDHKRYFSKEALIETFKQAGFSEISHKYFEFGLNHMVSAKKPLSV